MAPFCGITIVLEVICTVVHSVSLLSYNPLWHCPVPALCKEKYQDGSGKLCMGQPGDCACASNVCTRVNFSCVHSCNEFEVTSCLDCLQTSHCSVCYAQCAMVCLDPHCKYSGDTNVCGPCVSGYYGQSCNKNCSALCEGACFHDSGFCETCENNTFGRQCENACPKLCTTCSTQNGSCLHCVDGYIGGDCSIACPSGFYGAGCSTVCPENCDSRTCNHETGQCIGGCRPGYYGRRCTIECPEGTYGSECASECPVTCAGNKTCHHINGWCENGCNEGFHGDHCNVLCSLGKYGGNCAHNCSENCVLVVCNRFSGHCHTCVQGREGPFCQDVTSAQTMRASLDDDQSVSIDETILIFLALFSVGGATWFLLGACIYYKQKRIREKIERTGRLPRSWHSVINRHPQFFIYSGLRNRSSFLWRTPSRRWGMKIKKQTFRENLRNERLLRKLLQETAKAKLEKVAENTKEMSMNREQRVDDRTNVTNEVITADVSCHGKAGDSEKREGQQINRGVSGISSEMRDKENAISSDFKIIDNATNIETIKVNSEHNIGGKIENYEKECTEVAEGTSKMSLHNYNPNSSTRLMPGNKGNSQTTPCSQVKSQSSVMAGLKAAPDIPVGKENLTERPDSQRTSNVRASDRCQDGRNEEMMPLNIPGAEKAFIHPSSGGDTRVCNLDENSRGEVISDKKEIYLNRADAEARLTDCSYKGNIALNTGTVRKGHSNTTHASKATADTPYPHRMFSDLARGEPSWSDTITKGKWPFTEEGERTWSAHEFPKPGHETTAISSICSSCGKQCLCSLRECQGSNVTTVNEQGDPFVPILKVGEVYNDSDKLNRHKRPTVLLRDGAYIGRSLSRVKTADEFFRETEKVQDRAPVNLLRPTTQNKSRRYQSGCKSRRTQGRHERSSENVQEVTSTTFHSEAEASEASTSLSGSSTVRTSKHRSGLSTASGSYSSQSGSTSSVVSSSALSLTATSSLGVPSERLHSKTRQATSLGRQSQATSLGRQSVTSAAKPTLTKRCGSFDVKSRSPDKDWGNNVCPERNSSPLNVFQRGYKQVVSAVNKLFSRNRPDETNLYDTAKKMSPKMLSPQKPASSKFLIYRLEEWQKCRNHNRGTGADPSEKNKSRHTQLSPTGEHYTSDRAAGNLSESSTTMVNTLGTSKIKEESSLTGQSDVWLSSRAVSASTFSRGTRYSASAGISATNSSSSSHNSTSAASLSSSQQTMTTERDDPRTDADSVSVATKSTIRYPRPYASKYAPRQSSKRQAELPNSGHRQGSASILSRNDFSAKKVADPIQKKHRPSLHY